MKKLGQHFLRSRSALRLITESLDLAADDIVIEIGPGHGELTEFLAATPAKKIIAIERDEDFFHSLSTKFAADNHVAIFHGDALETLPNLINDPRSIIRHYKIAGNIPYYITGHLLRTIGELDPKPDQCSFTIQKEVAERICAAPPRMNRLAASVQFWANAKIIKILPASDFSPPPKVSSAIIVLKTITSNNVDPKNYYAAVRALFAQPRKTVLNNLAKAIGQKGDIVTKKLLAIGVSPDNRPQDLKVNYIADIARAFFSPAS